ncbi:hypothetical protein KC19_4G116300 [Ceratodon purpureus]|uniref:BHLH domain-containing protein n=1 Tax=Ceratodon purpureus TaxID=3225 RepID=A0A8T0I9Q4_CERPU|nr:hypothetical protein KC19_4G116300 [Ceratodon purpureus]
MTKQTGPGGVQERLRSIVGPKGWDYAVFWQLHEETRSLDWTGCCCSGAGAAGNDNLVASTSSRYLDSSTGCPDVKGYHPPIHICSFLANMPSSVSLDSGIQGRVFLGGQPKWVHVDPSIDGQDTGVQTKVCIPVQSGLVELGVANHVTENAALVQYVRARCGEPWQSGISKQGSSGTSTGLDGSGGHGMVDQQAVKMYYSRHFPTNLDSAWPSSHPWEQEDPMLESQLMRNMDQELIQLPGSTPHFPHHGTLAESPRGSGLSKDDGEVKQEMRGESSDCSDPMEDDDEKGGPRSARRHLSKNLVAERKRRKKLNERLYSLRALVPKITKMDRASILGDAIEYVKELQQQVKELQEELLLDSKENELAAGLNFDEPGGVTADEATQLGGGLDMGQYPAKVDSQSITIEVIDRKGDQELTQPMQVEVNKMDGRLFSLRIFCEKRPGVFVKLMQALDVLGLNVVHANITTFRGLVLNIFNAEVRDKELVGVEQMRDTLLEMASGHRALTHAPADGPSLQQSSIGGERVLDTVNEGPLP